MVGANRRVSEECVGKWAGSSQPRERDMASKYRKTGVAGLLLIVVLTVGGVSAAAEPRGTVVNPGWVESSAGPDSGEGSNNNEGHSWNASRAISPDGMSFITWSDESSGYRVNVRRWNSLAWAKMEGNFTTDNAINDYWDISNIPSLAQAHGDSPDEGQAEARREGEMAAEAEANLPTQDNGNEFRPRIAITAPLFIGVDDPAISSYLVDPASGQEYPLFDGLEVWGATYDAENQVVYIASGALLYRWPTNATPELVGTIKGATTNANLSITGLAFHDDTLYGLHPIYSGSDDPKAVYIINPATAKATLYTQFDAPADQIDMGGLAVDPATGTLYATNEAPALRGLVTIDPTGTVTVVAPYPAGQNDIDGLAIGNGRAYLLTDEPGYIYVVNLSSMTYEAPIDNPWTTPELFAGAASIGDSESVTPSIAINKTVGTNPNACAIESQVTVLPGTDVTYCYEVINVGGVALSRHTLEDSELGTLLDGFAYSLVPGASAFITATATINQTTISSAIWTAFNPGPTDVVWATATAKVSVIDDPVPPTCYPLTLTHTGSGGNPTASPPNSVGCGAGRYTAAQVITLDAAPAAGHRVKNWNGTANDASTSTTNSLTMPAADHTASVTYEAIPGLTFRAFAPAILAVPQTCLSGPNEAEPNNTAAAANGPLCNGSTYKGRPNDEYDIFYVDLKRPGDIAVSLSNHPSANVQLALHYQIISSNALDIDANGSDGFTVGNTNGQPGRYFIVIYVPTQHTGSTEQYSLRATFTE
jgi:hypothetical protein